MNGGLILTLSFTPRLLLSGMLTTLEGGKTGFTEVLDDGSSWIIEMTLAAV